MNFKDRPNSNSKINTSIKLAKELVDHFQPEGIILEPCCGEGNFLKVLPKEALWCEIDKGVDFFTFETNVDWIITNPPFNDITKFLEHSLEISNNICFIMFIQQLWTKKRLQLIRDNNFGIKEICIFKEPDNFPHTGLQIGMVHLQRNYINDIKVSILYW